MAQNQDKDRERISGQSLRKEFRCDVNLPHAHLTIYSPDQNVVLDMLKRIEPRATFKTTTEGDSLLAFTSPADSDDPMKAIAVISELEVPQSWTTTRNEHLIKQAA